MEIRFLVWDRGLESALYKIPINQTARIQNELALQGAKVQVFHSLEEAKAAATSIVDSIAVPKSTGFHSNSVAEAVRARHLKAKFEDATEDNLDLFDY